MTLRAFHAAGDESPFRLRLVLENDPGRDALESFLRDRYARAFGAQITSFMPWLVEMRDGANTPVGALGLRSAAAGPLFLERYLDAPAEQAVAAATGRVVDRRSLVEIGNFAADSPGALRQLIVPLIRCLRRAGLEWALFTLLPSTRNAFTRFGLPLIPLAEARADCLAAEARATWGDYYDRKPRVLAGSLAEGYRLLDARGPKVAPAPFCDVKGVAAAWV